MMVQGETERAQVERRARHTNLARATILLISVVRVDLDGVRVIRVATWVMQVSKFPRSSVCSTTHMSASLSWLRAFLQAAWNACSTLTASLADVSKYGMLPLD